MIDTTKIAEILRAANLQLFKDTYSRPTSQAQYNLEGRTHYVDSDTLRYFHSRIVSARPCMSETFFRIVECCSMDYENTKRGYRVVLFDIFGNVVYRVDSVDMFRTRKQAELAFDAWLGAFDPAAYYRHTLAARSGRLAAESKSAELASLSI